MIFVMIMVEETLMTLSMMLYSDDDYGEEVIREAELSTTTKGASGLGGSKPSPPPSDTSCFFIHTLTH